MDPSPKCSELSRHSSWNASASDVKEAFSHVIFVYGRCSIQKPFAITGSEFDEHFGWPVQEAVEQISSYFKERLFSILSEA